MNRIEKDFCNLCLSEYMMDNQMFEKGFCKDFPGGRMKFPADRSEPIQRKGFYVADCDKLQRAKRVGIPV